MASKGKSQVTKPVSRWSWLKFAPFVMLPAAALGFETHCRVELIENDYLSESLSQERSELREAINELEAEKARLERLDRMDDALTNLGLVLPKPGQVRRLDAAGP
jgi:DNA repair exonuclease SbcCD ATPase subunit